MASSKTVGGDLSAFSIFDVTQSLMMSRKTAEVMVQSGGRKGFLYFKNGQIVAAIDDSLNTGEQAATTVFSWRGGTFSIEMGKVVDQENIDVATDYLLLEVARNLDEVSRDRAEATERRASRVSDEGISMELEVQERLEDRLRRKLNTAFEQVAHSVEPARALHSATAFDDHLKRMVSLGGSSLFVQAGSPPRIRTGSGFTVLDEDDVSEEELELFVHALLDKRTLRDLVDRREASTMISVRDTGSFRVHAVKGGSGYLLTFTALRREVPGLHEIIEDADQLQALKRIDRGLIVVAGPLGSGKPALVASLALAHMTEREAFAILFDADNAYSLESEKGYGVHRETPPPGAAFAAGLRAAIRQAPDVLGIAGTSDRDALRDAFHAALGAAGGDRLVVYSLDSQSPSDTMARLMRLSRTADGDPLNDSLALQLRAIVDLAPGSALTPRLSRFMPRDEPLADMVRRGDLPGLKRLVISDSRTIA